MHGLCVVQPLNHNTDIETEQHQSGCCRIITVNRVMFGTGDGVFGSTNMMPWCRIAFLSFSISPIYILQHNFAEISTSRVTLREKLGLTCSES